MKRLINIVLIFALTIGLSVSIVSCGNNTSDKPAIKTCYLTRDSGSSVKTVYDENGNTLSEVGYDSDGELSYEIIYTWDDNEKDFTSSETNKAGGWTSTVVGTYNNNKTKLNYTETTEMSYSETIYECEITFDKNGNVLREDEYEDGEYSFGAKYTYDKNNSELKIINYDSDKKVESEINYTYEYTYYDDGNVETKISHSDTGYNYKYEYTYDKHGNILTESCYDIDNNSQVYLYTYEYVYFGDEDDFENEIEVSDVDIKESESERNSNSSEDSITSNEIKESISADELGITTDELITIIYSLDFEEHDFEDLDEVESQVELGASLAFKSDPDQFEFSYSTSAHDDYGLAIWSIDNYNYAEVASQLLNGNSDAQEVWDALLNMAVVETNSIDSWTSLALKDDSYHTLTGLINNSNGDKIIVVVYDGEVIYDATKD